MTQGPARPRFGLAKVIPHLPDVDGLIKEVRDRLTRIEDRLKSIEAAMKGPPDAT